MISWRFGFCWLFSYCWTFKSVDWKRTCKISISCCLTFKFLLKVAKYFIIIHWKAIKTREIRKNSIISTTYQIKFKSSLIKTNNFSRINWTNQNGHFFIIFFTMLLLLRAFNFYAILLCDRVFLFVLVSPILRCNNSLLTIDTFKSFSINEFSNYNED